MLLYAVTKFIAYGAWCLVGLRLFAPARASVVSSLKYGSLRWLLGLFFGLVVGVALGSVSKESVTTLYFGVYIPLRIVEWGIMAIVIRRFATSGTASLGGARIWLWIIGGIVVSFLSDIASPEGMAGRFCVGRCLC